jgi:TP901-1 family phage major tail protein
MANTIIKGDDLMLFDEQGKSIAFATSHTLSISADAVDTTSKDHGVWGANEVNKITWEITSENLYTVTAYDSLMEKMLARTPIKVYFGTKKENDPDKTVADGDYQNWTGASGYTGNVYITSLSVNANTGENATYSATFTGTGKLIKCTTIPVAGN